MIISVSYTHLNGEVINAKKVVLAPGRDGSAWLTKVLKKHGLELYNNQVDIGVRAVSYTHLDVYKRQEILL